MWPSNTSIPAPRGRRKTATPALITRSVYPFSHGTSEITKGKYDLTVAKPIEELVTPKSRRRRLELLHAGKQAFETRGYFETRVADVVELAQVSQGTFYSYFDSKDDILRALVSTMVDGMMAQTAAPVRSTSTPFRTLQGTIEQFMASYRDNAAMIAVLEQAATANEYFREFRQSIRDRWGRRLHTLLVNHFSTHPDGVGIDLEIGSFALGGMLDDFAYGVYILGHVVDEKAAGRTLTVLWARAAGIPIQE